MRPATLRPDWMCQSNKRERNCHEPHHADIVLLCASRGLAAFERIETIDAESTRPLIPPYDVSTRGKR
jgi:hypothetical protein